MRAATIHEQQRLRLLSRTIVARHYRRCLTVQSVARALSISPRQLQRAYMRCGPCSFSEELLSVRMSVAAQLLVEQPSIPVADVARLVGYREATHFGRAFRRRYGLPPALFRKRERERKATVRVDEGQAARGCSRSCKQSARVACRGRAVSGRG